MANDKEKDAAKGKAPEEQKPHDESDDEDEDWGEAGKGAPKKDEAKSEAKPDAKKPEAKKPAESDEEDDDEDDEDEDDEDEDDEEEEEKPADKKSSDKPADKKAEAKKADAKKADDDEEEDDEDDDEEDDEDDEDDEDEDEEKKVEAKPAKSPPPKPGQKPGAKPGAKRPGAPSRARKAAVPQKGGSFAKSMLIFLVLMGAIVAAIGYATCETRGGPGGPTKVDWKKGDTVDVEITVVANDKNDLQCASPNAAGTRHCKFEDDNKPWSKGGDSSDANMLMPYTTVNHIQLLAAGFWSQPSLAKPPGARFAVKCKYKVEEKLKDVKVRWHAKDPFGPPGEWFAGSVSDCAVVSK